jgi:DNA sulfur modification protein DndE
MNSQKIFSSKKAANILESLRDTTRLDLSILARIAVSYSISHKEIVVDESEFGNRDGKEFNLYSLLGEYGGFYRNVLIVDNNKKLDDVYFNELLKYHMERGLKILFQLLEKSNFNSENFLLVLNDQLVENESSAQKQNILPLILKLGTEELTNKNIILELNNKDKNPNFHLAITGIPGTGKTQVLLNLLYQIRKQTEYSTNFIFFDYKGEFINSNGQYNDKAKEWFVNETKAEMFQLPGDQIPINPFILNKYDDNDVKISAQQKAESFSSINNRTQFGTVQKETLVKTIVKSYEKRKNDPKQFPDFQELYQELKEEYENTGKKDDTLSSILRQLSEFHLFWEHGSSKSVIKDLTSKTFIIDLSKMLALKELVAYLVIERLYQEMCQLPDLPPINGLRQIRTILVIDEAHNYLSQKNIFLQKIVREGRSKGIGVFFASQSPSDYEQKSFDFKELLSFFLLFKSGTLSPNTIQNLIGCNPSVAKELQDKITKLKPFECITKYESIERGYTILKADALYETYNQKR